jgi:YD repeat-containing protein
MFSGQRRLVRALAVVAMTAGAVVGLVNGNAGAATASVHVRTSVVVLPTLGGDNSDAIQINDAGTIIGQSSDADGEFHAVRWDSHGHITELGSPDGQGSSPIRINSRGVVIGDMSDGGGTEHAVRWDARGRFTDLGTLPGGTFSQAAALNDSGEVVGMAETAADANGNMEGHAVRWDSHGHITDLGTPGIGSQAYAINNEGMVAGSSNFKPARWDSHGRLTMLSVPAGAGGEAFGINDQGMTVGHVQMANGVDEAARWDRRGRMTNLGALPGGSISTAGLILADGTVFGDAANSPDVESQRTVRWSPRSVITAFDILPGGLGSDPRGVNRQGIAAGEASMPVAGNQENRAVWWDRRGRITSLGALPGGAISIAEDINDANRIVGESQTTTGFRAVLWILHGSRFYPR